MNIRCFAPADSLAVLDLLAAHYQDLGLEFPREDWTWTLEDIGASALQIAIVAQRDPPESEWIDGFLLLTLKRRAGEKNIIQEGCIREIIVRPCHRKQGLGAALLRNAINYALSHDVAKIRVEVDIMNLQGTNLLLAAGFKKTTMIYEWSQK